MDFIKYFIKVAPLHLSSIVLAYLVFSGDIWKFINWYTYELKMPDIVK